MDRLGGREELLPAFHLPSKLRTTRETIQRDHVAPPFQSHSLRGISAPLGEVMQIPSSIRHPKSKSQDVVRYWNSLRVLLVGSAENDTCRSPSLLRRAPTFVAQILSPIHRSLSGLEVP